MTYLDESHTKPIRDALNDVRQHTGYGWLRVFRDWTEIVFLSLQRDDDSYDKLVADYEAEHGEDGTRAMFETYAAAFGNLVVATGETEADVLGHVHQHCGLGSEDSGQFFTPTNVSRAMAGMMLPDATSIRDSTPTDPLKIGDPASGSGGLLVAAGRTLERTADSPYAALFVGQDIDPLCARMTAVNLALCGLPGYAVHGDSLRAPETAIAAWRIDHSQPQNGVIHECDPMPVAFGSSGGDTSKAEHGEKDSSSDHERSGVIADPSTTADEIPSEHQTSLFSFDSATDDD